MHQDHDLATSLNQMYCYDMKRTPSLYMSDNQHRFCNFSLVSSHCAKLKQDTVSILIAKGHSVTYAFPYEYRNFQCQKGQ